jgi:hypothetical protein
MRTLFLVALAGHGLIHLIGAAKAFHVADLPELTRPISTSVGVLWLTAAALFVASACSLLAWPRWWWVLGACAIPFSVFAISRSWSDAKVGAAANAVILIGVIYGFLSQGPFSLRAEYERDVAGAVLGTAHTAPVHEDDIRRLPAPVQRYLRASGAVGQPRVSSFYIRMHGRIRSGSDGRWIPISAEQYNAMAPPARLFYLRGSMFTIPMQGYHRYIGSEASMRVKAAALLSVVDMSGTEMTQSETVTLFNDMCVFAPSTLIDPAIVWERTTDRTATARFTNAGHTIRAELAFNDLGELVNFHSNDRYAAASGGQAARKTPWSTPLAAYRSFGAVRLASSGQGRWETPGDEYVYIELTIDEVRYNVVPRLRPLGAET